MIAKGLLLASSLVPGMIGKDGEPIRYASMETKGEPVIAKKLEDAPAWIPVPVRINPAPIPKRIVPGQIKFGPKPAPAPLIGDPPTNPLDLLKKLFSPSPLKPIPEKAAPAQPQIAPPPPAEDELAPPPAPLGVAPKISPNQNSPKDTWKGPAPPPPKD